MKKTVTGKKLTPAAPAEKVALYDTLVACFPDIERKGASMPYTSINGHMTSYLHPEGFLALRLAKGDLEDFLREFDTELVRAHGIVQKEYAVVPDALLANTDAMRPYMEASLRYVRGLKPKPATKKNG
jgi:hypothetical protein